MRVGRRRKRQAEEDEDRRRKLSIEDEDRQCKLSIEDEEHKAKRAKITEEQEEEVRRKDRTKHPFVWPIVDAVHNQSLSNEDAIRAVVWMLAGTDEDVRRVQTATTISSGNRRMIKQFYLVVARLTDHLTPVLGQMGNGDLRTEKDVWRQLQEILGAVRGEAQPAAATKAEDNRH